MRHFLAIGTLPIRVTKPAITALLVAPPRLALRLPARSHPATQRAIPVAAIAATAEEEDLKTASANDVPKGIQAEAGSATNWSRGMDTRYNFDVSKLSETLRARCERALFFLC